MALQDTASTAGILAELNNRLTSYETTIRELRTKNRDFVNRLRDSQQIRKDLCIKVNSLQNDLEKRDKELKTQKEQNKQLKKRVSNLNELNSNYQNKIEELKSLCDKLRNDAKNELNTPDSFVSVNTENANLSCINVNEGRPNKNASYQIKDNHKSSESLSKNGIPNSTELYEVSDSAQVLQSNQNKSLLVKKGDLKFSIEEINDLNMKYTPVPDDPIDRAIATFTNSRKNKILFTRVKQGTYVYGRLMVEAKLVTKPGVDKNKPLLRIVSRGKLYTLADFVNTHENEELNNIEDSIRNQNSNLVSDGSALVVASPLNQFRSTQVLNPSSPIKIAPTLQQNPTNAMQSTTNIHHFIQSPLSFASSRVIPPIIDSKHNQGVNLQKYMVNYPTNTHELLPTPNTNSMVTPTYYNNINGMQQLSPIGHKNSYMQLPQIVPQHQFPYYHHIGEGSGLNNQFNQNLSYHSKSNSTVLAPPPVAEYMPVTTPIIMTRQPINALNCTNNSIQQVPIIQNIPQGTKTNEQKFSSLNNKLECFIQQDREAPDINNSLSPQSIQKIPQEHAKQSDSTYLNKKNLTNEQNKNIDVPIKEIGNETHPENDLDLNKDNTHSQKNVVNHSSSPIKSVSASTIGEWYRQANIMKRCNSYSCENLSSTNKNI
ncbi:putative coiled coil protein [Cryptosporidium canis]|uniref:Coiled coil protein n=1 Tax=Cryptosporidium canis TaxID=195482 RepID=A0A9D5DJM8_9CRYT|nr:putative coiled coil protein [Cryptosporidium canis]